VCASLQDADCAHYLETAPHGDAPSFSIVDDDQLYEKLLREADCLALTDLNRIKIGVWQV
jgi:hypothetical protein